MYFLKTNMLLFYVNYFSNTDAVKTLPQHATCIYFLVTDEIPTSIYQNNQISFAVPIRHSTNSILFFLFPVLH